MASQRPHFICRRSFSSTSAWCAQVAAQPEQSRISVLIKGRCQGSKVSMPSGGQTPGVTVTPSIVPIGYIACLKNDQNQAEKNMISEMMNSIMP